LIFNLYLGNKQFQRQKESSESEYKRSEDETPAKSVSKNILNKFNKSNKIVDVHDKSILPSEIKSKTDVEIFANNNLYSTPNVDYVLSGERVKSVQPSLPIKINVVRKPSTEDLSRMYNPYIIQDNYDHFVKKGYLNEPAQQQHYDRGYVMNRANITFSNEMISPYAQSVSRASILKNPVENNELINFLSNRNRKIIGNYEQETPVAEYETEFQNLNNLKSFRNDVESKQVH
jgi:hypothetical protein